MSKPRDITLSAYRYLALLALSTVTKRYLLVI